MEKKRKGRKGERREEKEKREKERGKKRGKEREQKERGRGRKRKSTIAMSSFCKRSAKPGNMVVDPVSITLEYKILFLYKRTKQHNFDPLIAANWLTVQQQDVLKVKVSSRSLLSEILRSSTRFSVLGLGYIYPPLLAFVHNVTLFTNLAQYLTSFWFFFFFSYSFVCLFKGAAAVLGHHKRSLKQAIIDLYPELHLKKQDFEGTIFSLSHSLLF